jgi:capsular polysaccharide transport system permease protein
MFLTTLATRRRVIGALVMREIYSRYGRDSLGFGWLVVEPLMFVFPVLTMWSFVRGRVASEGVPVMVLCWTGYLPLMLFRHLTGSSINVIREHTAVFFHRPISALDVILSRILVETLSNICAVAVSLGALLTLGVLDVPQNLPLFYLGYFYIIWWCSSLAMVVGAFGPRTIWIEKIWMVVGYMYVALSGCFYMADYLPDHVRYWALFQPSLQAYEMIRAGMLGPSVRTYYDFGYETAVLTIITLIGLIGVYQVREFIVME